MYYWSILESFLWNGKMSTSSHTYPFSKDVFYIANLSCLSQKHLYIFAFCRMDSICEHQNQLTSKCSSHLQWLLIILLDLYLRRFLNGGKGITWSLLGLWLTFYTLCYSVAFNEARWTLEFEGCKAFCSCSSSIVVYHLLRKKWS